MIEWKKIQKGIKDQDVKCNEMCKESEKIYKHKVVSATVQAGRKLCFCAGRWRCKWKSKWIIKKMRNRYTSMRIIIIFLLFTSLFEINDTHFFPFHKYCSTRVKEMLKHSPGKKWIHLETVKRCQKIILYYGKACAIEMFEWVEDAVHSQKFQISTTVF